ncbi:hypothetical protein [Burkholderia oklahomensis]|uniref:hypothetical protein n=1 Tax=Burkholderia oklahomensis TaxID=342113 RepID=UPI000AC4A623|nr:hypothetical protein [Burkholderia oklahomensis]
MNESSERGARSALGRSEARARNSRRLRAHELEVRILAHSPLSHLNHDMGQSAARACTAGRRSRAREMPSSGLTYLIAFSYERNRMRVAAARRTYLNMLRLAGTRHASIAACESRSHRLVQPRG